MIPVIIGVADVKNRSTKSDDAKEPATLMLESIEAAIKDASSSPEEGLKLRSNIDSIDVVKSWTWPYADLPGLLAQKLGVQPKHKHYSEHGGNQPAKLLDNAARRIATGESQVAVLTGAEALASCKLVFGGNRSLYSQLIVASCVKDGKMPPPGWTSGPEAESITDVFSPTTRELKKGMLHSKWTNYYAKIV